jgi:hypothetical protein
MKREKNLLLAAQHMTGLVGFELRAFGPRVSREWKPVFEERCSRYCKKFQSLCIRHS